MIYLDNAASAPPREELVENFGRWLMQYYPNPDATHEAGYQSLLAVQRSERKVVNLTSASGLAEIVWTGTATEALNLGITGYCANFSDGNVVTTAIEHKAVLEPVKRSHLIKGFLPMTKVGIIDIERAGEVLNEKTRLIALHHVNNETGAVQPIEELARLRDKLAPQAKILLDASQSFGKIAISWKKMGINMLVATAHKIHGINGTAMLQFEKGMNLQEQSVGGGQQGGLRSGTLNVPGIVAFSEAASMSVMEMDEVTMRLKQINSFTRAELTKRFGERVVFHATEDVADPHILSFALEGYQGAILMRFMGAEGVIVGTGSACLAEVDTASHVMTALGVPKHLAFSTLRVSFGRQNTMEDAKQFLDKLELAVKEY